MRKLLALFLLVASPAMAQAVHTSVTINATDSPDTQAWANGYYITNLVTNPGSSNGTSSPGPTGALDASGNATFTLTSQNDITFPTGGEWEVTVCPQMGCLVSSYTQLLPGITGTSVSFNLVPPSFRQPIYSARPVNAYRDSEVVSNILGSEYFNVAASALKFCQALPCTGNWNSIGGGGGISSFNQLASGTNTTATMGIASGALLIGTGSGVVNLSAITSVNNFLVPSIASALPTTAAALAYDSTANRFVGGNGTNTSFFPWFTSAPTSGQCPQFSGTSGLLVSVACASGTGTVTHTAGALTASAIVIGNGAADATVLASLGTSTTVLHGNASGNPSFGSVTLTSDVAGVLPVANGGLGISTGLSGGVPCFTGTGTIASSSALPAGDFLLGGGAGACPTATFSIVPVANGGTGIASGNSGGVLGYTASGTLASSATLTAHGVVIGGGAGSTPSSTAVGVAGQVLTSNGSGADPTFQNSAGGGGLSGLTTGVIPQAGSATTIINSSPQLDNGVSTANTLTYAGSGGISLTGGGSGKAGAVALGQGTLPSLGTTSIELAAPTSVTSWQLVLPGTAATGIPHYANSSNTVTETVSAVNLASGDITGILPLANMSQSFLTNPQTATYQVLAADFADCKTIPVASGTFTITLVASTSQPANGQCLQVINYGSGVVTIARSGQTINGAAANLTLAAGSASGPNGAGIFSDGSNYQAQVYGAGAAGGVSSFTGDGTLITNSGSTGSVTTTLGTAGAHKYLGNNTGSPAAPGYFQPAFTDLSGTIGCGQLPALAGDTTSIAASCTTTTSKINGTAFSGANGDVVSFGASNTPADSGFLATNVVRKDAANTGGASMTLDLSASTSAAALKIPQIAGATTTTAGSFVYDTTNKNVHVGGNSVDNINVVVPSSVTITNNDCVKWSNASSVITLADAGSACGAGGGGVSSFTGDSHIITNSASTGGVTTTIAGTSGGVPYFSSSSAWQSSALLTQFGVLFGGGAGGAPTSSAQGGSNFPLIGQGAANPIFSTIAYPTSLTSGGILYGSSTTALASSGLLTSKQVVIGGGSGSAPTSIDFPDVHIVPAANCNGTTPGAGWSIGASGSVACRAGTNNLGGYVAITDTSSSFATFQIAIPEDWDTGSNPYIRFQLASSDATNAHTVIPSIQVACYKGDGSTTDDVAANAAHSLSTVTLNGNANRFWSSDNVQMNSTDVTGCVAGALMQVTVGRATDTATNAEFYSATVTFPRLLTVQAN